MSALAASQMARLGAIHQGIMLEQRESGLAALRLVAQRYREVLARPPTDLTRGDLKWLHEQATETETSVMKREKELETERTALATKLAAAAEGGYAPGLGEAPPEE